MSSDELKLIIRQLIEEIPQGATSDYNSIFLSKNYLPNNLEEEFKYFKFYYFNHWFIRDNIYISQSKNWFIDEDK